MIKRTFWLLFGLLSLLLGIVGVFLPLLPTTPFVLLSAYCFSKSSKRLHLWLLNHKLFGSLISDWEKHGVIRTKTKCIATASMLILVSYPLFFLPIIIWVKLTVIITILSVLIFIWTRPSSPIDV
ncbi:YbaN family protein [Pseudoalteromonas sp. C2R02]|uniref:YbaN family protein n=1 Tax=Pseudoalteromonas sp. C2R02 TaxID=2841565 RepID=UPI001C08CD2D|nr:YbaN family protein [Pseudoalteromonas sp. C2R02]MBU2971769.1 YbaN family protein [Pseudoalteromonas sp. C2R02]